MELPDTGRILSPVIGLGEKTVSQASTSQSSLITPLTSLLSVLDLTNNWIDKHWNRDLINQHENK